MKRSPLLVLAFFASVLLGNLGFSAPAGKPLWTCGMHPQIIKTQPGNCPICGMKLVPVRSGVGAGSNGAIVHIAPEIAQRMNLKTALVVQGPVRREIRTVGSVAYNEEGIRDITTKYEGWIEKLFVNTTWANIKAGDPLFEIYSPDLYNAELNFLVAQGTEHEPDGPLMRAAVGRLQLFDVPQAFIAELAKTGQAQRTFVYRAPTDGVVVEKSAVVGQMLKPGERIYQIADLSSVWVLAQIYEQDLPFVKRGQDALVTVTYGPDHSYAGTVSLVVPQIDEQTRAATARIELPNPDHVLRPGMFVDVRFDALIADSAALVPEEAILRSGDRDTVFVAKDGGTFEAREVKLGARSANGDYEVLQGLAPGERVVTSGQFMLDSESQLDEAIENLSRGANGMPTSSTSSGPMPNAQRSTQAAPELIALASATADAAAALASDDLASYNRARQTVNNSLSAWLANVGGRGEAGPGSTPPGTMADVDGVTSPRGNAGTQRSGVGAPRPHPETLAPLPLAADLKSARDSFEPFSTAVTDMARTAHVGRTAGLHAFECPMPPSGSAEKARWLQRTAGTKNPFYGSAMPTCGEEIK